MKLGLDIFLEKGFRQFKNKRIGLVTNMTGVNGKLTPTIDLFFEHPGIKLTALFGPEHGIRGDAKEGQLVESSIDPATGLPVFSLYGKDRKPSIEMLDSLDVIVFDLQDIGSRYYTFIYTMAYVMEACAENEKHFVVLDRPNPITGEKVEGNLVEEDVRSFVGLYPILNRHGMTVGELAQLYKYEFGINCELTVVPMEGWKRNMYFDETALFWVPPSPNTTNLDMTILYPGTCLIEGTNLSEGRGTTKPFEMVGAPFIDGQKLSKEFNNRKISGLIARTTSFIPTYQKHKDEVCGGIQLHVTDRNKLNSLQAGIALLEIIAEMYPNDFNFIRNDSGKYFFDLLAGTKQLRKHVLNKTSTGFLLHCKEQVGSFQKLKEPYLIYK
ncbi:hypothetical protein A8F94_14200 [Bacillus sp. FJAT-27225]|uniref:exo-beta-N-acetylmuramidase NamZ family protein n=1 Tax=Bacillus sp. FJAT-27225 TaxID=1743144 RepID=UPI00080C27E3|nr:DUF1343 domain-containing protein [Bacillus sp. FJAT-27225]OCA85993.1 hypothetical protein A8F94_14200 [Bacillus sp. FJAT-27225]